MSLLSEEEQQALNRWLVLAIEDAEDDAVESLLACGAHPLEARDRAGRNAFTVALVSGTTRAVAAMINWGVDVNASESCVWPPLVVVAVRNNLEMASFLIKRGAKVNGPLLEGGFRESALQRSKSREMTRLLLDAGADINARSPRSYDNFVKGSTALMEASRWGITEVVDELLKAGADHSIPNSQGLTPLLAALEWRSVDVAKQLLDAGANINTKTGDLSTALHLAAAHAGEDLVQALLGSNMHMAAGHGDTQLVESMISRGLSPHQKNMAGETPLISAICAGNYRTTLFLMKHLNLSPMEKIEGKTLLRWFSKNPEAKEAVKEAQRQWKAEQIAKQLASSFDTLTDDLPSPVFPQAKKSKGLSL